MFKTANGKVITARGYQTMTLVLDCLERNPDTKPYHIWYYGLSGRQISYWANKITEWGYAEKIQHGHNRYNQWTGYKLLKGQSLILWDITGVPF